MRGAAVGAGVGIGSDPPGMRIDSGCGGRPSNGLGVAAACARLTASIKTAAESPKTITTSSKESLADLDMGLEGELDIQVDEARDEHPQEHLSQGQGDDQDDELP